MTNKITKIVFSILFLIMLIIPLAKTNFEKGVISEAENRYLADLPAIKDEEGKYNKDFTRGFETWFNDHVGFRSDFVIANAKIQFYGFNVLANNTDMYLGPKGELNYATPAMLDEYQHIDLKSEATLNHIVQGFNIAEEYLSERGIQFYYYQCWDKHSIYPEQFPTSVKQIGDVSRADQILKVLEDNTNVTVVSPKQALIDAKSEYDTYSEWGDPTHWTQRGAFIGYGLLMDAINQNNDYKFKVLQEDDYDITIKDMGNTVFGGIHKECMQEEFTIKEPKAYLTNEKLVFLGDSPSHQFFTNDSVDNDTRVLVFGDSYFNNFIMDDLAESFHEILIIWGDRNAEEIEVIDTYEPDIIIVENAERCDRADMFAGGAMPLQER